MYAAVNIYGSRLSGHKPLMNDTNTNKKPALNHAFSADDKDRGILRTDALRCYLSRGLSKELKNMESKNIAVKHNRLGLFLLVLDLKRCQKGLVLSKDNLFTVQKASNGS